MLTLTESDRAAIDAIYMDVNLPYDDTTMGEHFYLAGVAAERARHAAVPREPTEAMLEAGRAAYAKEDYTSNAIIEAWCAMYDAALTGPCKHEWAPVGLSTSDKWCPKCGEPYVLRGSMEPDAKMYDAAPSAPAAPPTEKIVLDRDSVANNLQRIADGFIQDSVAIMSVARAASKLLQAAPLPADDAALVELLERKPERPVLGHFTRTGMEYVMRWVDEAAARIEAQAQRIERQRILLNAAISASNAAIDRAETAEARVAELEQREAQLTGRMCLICGKPEPCKESPDACTFDPNPIEAARSFLLRATKAESALAAAQKDAARYRWLRECSPTRSDRNIQVRISHYLDGQYITTDYINLADLDAAIDAAIAIAAPSGEEGKG